MPVQDQVNTFMKACQGATACLPRLCTAPGTWGPTQSLSCSPVLTCCTAMPCTSCSRRSRCAVAGCPACCACCGDAAAAAAAPSSPRRRLAGESCAAPAHERMHGTQSILLQARWQGACARPQGLEQTRLADTKCSAVLNADAQQLLRAITRLRQRILLALPGEGGPRWCCSCAVRDAIRS